MTREREWVVNVRLKDSLYRYIRKLDAKFGCGSPEVIRRIVEAFSVLDAVGLFDVLKNVEELKRQARDRDGDSRDSGGQGKANGDEDEEG